MDVGFEFLHKAIATTLILALLSSGATLYFVGTEEAISLLFGGIWGSINLYLLKYLLQSLLLPGSKNYAKIALLAAVKFPLLYVAGYFALAIFGLSPYYSLLGFSLIFLVLILKGAILFPTSSKVSLLAISLMTLSSPLNASIESDVPEVPNIFTLLYKGAYSPLTIFLHQWENIIFSIILAAGIALLFCFGAKRRETIPSTRLQNFLELIVELMERFAHEILGAQGRKYVPFLGTLFIYIVMMNWMVLFPFMKAPSSSLSITAALAICVFVLVQYLSIQNFGFLGYLYHMAGSPKGALGWAMVPLMFPIELLTQLSRPLTLAFRLFGNVIGEDILIGAFALFGITLFSFLPIGLPLQMPFMLFAMLTGLMQALVFTLLTGIYILLSMPSDKH